MPVRKKARVSKPKERNKFTVTGRTPGQNKYIETIKKKTVTVCSGFAGTGKTLLAIGMALSLIQSPNNDYERIIIIRPAIEACGERIGFLPGGINDKMAPLVEPVMDNLRFWIKDVGYIQRLTEPDHRTGAPVIEVVPMAYLRGRTMRNCVVLFDEAQNATPAQMKLFLTRIGENCKVIIEGDVTQSDIHKNAAKNGLADAMSRLRGINSVGICTLGLEDIQRSKILAEILEKYDDITT